MYECYNNSRRKLVQENDKPLIFQRVSLKFMRSTFARHDQCIQGIGSKGLSHTVQVNESLQDKTSRRSTSPPTTIISTLSKPTKHQLKP